MDLKEILGDSPEMWLVLAAPLALLLLLIVFFAGGCRLVQEIEVSEVTMTQRVLATEARAKRRLDRSIQLLPM